MFAVDLYAGLGGWADGLLAAGFYVVGFDNERHVYGDMKYPAQLVVQDVRTLHGCQFKDARLIVASPPCQEFSYMAMPWSRAKQIARALRGEDEFPDGYTGSRTIAELTLLFDECFRIQREACEAAGRHIPMVVENVRGAQPWVGLSRWNYGSYYLWGDVPALMPIIQKRTTMKGGIAHRSGGATNFHSDLDNGRKVPGFRFDGQGSFQSASVYKSKGMDWSDRSKRGQDFTRVAGNQAMEQHIKLGGSWFGEYRKGQGMRNYGSKSVKRKMASAMIAKIPFDLSRYIGFVYAERWP